MQTFFRGVFSQKLTFGTGILRASWSLLHISWTALSVSFRWGTGAGSFSGLNTSATWLGALGPARPVRPSSINIARTCKKLQLSQKFVFFEDHTIKISINRAFFLKMWSVRLADHIYLKPLWHHKKCSFQWYFVWSLCLANGIWNPVISAGHGECNDNRP